MKRLRAAVYTRKSSEEGLDQSFNSLDAQREACEAYILSQRSEGWYLVPDRYDDGGWSGGNMARPGLRRLLADVEAGRIDIVVVYKVDRLSRSLSDFARMVDLFDRRGVSFVSVTQAFNTTTSMGRLTLNVLLSFAQFEREVTGERIRDKIAASKAKGMWMGGYPPFGYDPADRMLQINPAEADTLRRIYARYLELGSVHLLRDELAAAGVRTKIVTSRNGRVRGGGPFERGPLYHLLRNRIYLGEIVHKGVSHPGQHEAILDLELFAAVQDRLDANTSERRQRTESRAPLAGVLFDARGQQMAITHSRGRNGRLYGYYVSSAPAGEAGCDRVVRRIPAGALDRIVLGRLRSWSGRTAGDWAELLPFVRRIEIHRDAIVADLAPPPHEMWQPSPEEHCDRSAGTMTVTSPLRIRTRTGRVSTIESTGRAQPARPDKALIAGLRRAHAELSSAGIDLANGDPCLAAATGVVDPYLRRLSRLAFLAPDIQNAILRGRQPAGLALADLMRMDLPLSWRRQRELLGFASGAPA